MTTVRRAKSRRGALYAQGYKRTGQKRPTEVAPDGIRGTLHRAGGFGCCLDCGMMLLAYPPNGYHAEGRVAIIHFPQARCVEQRMLRRSESTEHATVQVRSRDGALVDAQVPLRPCRRRPS